MITIIQKRVYLEPKYLDQNIMDHLFVKITEDTFGECTKEYGHILSVKRIVEIVNNEDTIFTVRFEAVTLKPETGVKYTGVVCMVYKDGIFISVEGTQKMLIPSITLKGYTFEDVSGAYVNGDKCIKEGDTVDVNVTASKYNRQSFSCFGSLA
jgi:DNA-directed RNA polymerase subunit E'/Rpb7